jgi:transposase
MSAKKSPQSPQPAAGSATSPHTRPQAKPSRPSVADPRLTIAHPQAAGIDVHARAHWVCVPARSVSQRAPDQPANLPANVRAFGTCTPDLEQLADWLSACGISTVAMEATGVYWIALFELLERRGFEVILVDPRQTRQVAGRPQSDVLSCQWIQRLHSYGLLSASFRPDDQTCVFRGYLRQRQVLIADAGRATQHMQKALEQMNVKLAETINDITGVTGMLILKAILRGQRDPQELAKYRNEHCKCTPAEMARALQGNWREEHLFALRQALKTYEHLRRQLRECDDCIKTYLKTLADKSGGAALPAPKTPRRSRKATEPSFDARRLLFRWSGVDLTVIEGIDQSSALAILAEIGIDMSKWPTDRHFVSWLALCPQHRSSAGRIKNRRLRGGANRAARALRLAAQGCHHAKNALGAFYRRVQARAGGGKAVIATARKIACRVYRLLKYGEKYVRQEMAAYEAQFVSKTTQGLAKKAKSLGYKLVPVTEGQAQPS